jgi:hypothetical protein
MVPGVETLVQVLNAILSLGVITLLFAMMFKLLPDAEIAWHDVGSALSLRRCSSRWASLLLAYIWEPAA